MSESMLNTLAGLSGIAFAAVGMIITYVIFKKVGKKKRWFDERNQFVTNYAKALSWNVTLVSMMIAWCVVIIFDGISFAFFLLTALYLVHCISLLFTGMVASKKA
ncbi:DUF2178 domain-containing protein [Halalkalibacillus sediminis]|uniref:DUF2178 domain-containing protein n=1 Tax=Halalkalibacillus sediminis TaxID=2018042 RepID=A0A2I0QT62_9BACI|nr:DUF2178 domain-containing protein [Halalkalibacillus sediminis]PKR77532.1 DUF2178 domain-containing protein [Halalkalibacillus sediminis]